MTAHPDARRSRIRALLADVERAMVGTDAAPLQAAWRRLVVGLDLGAEPAVRACPHCAAIGMLAATRCGYCWAALPRPDESMIDS